MARDEIFKKEDASREFQFDGKVADVFDDMLNRSVPCYRMVIEMLTALLEKFLRNGDLVYDLGCSTGETVIELARHLDRLDLKFTGIDNSPAMLNKARHKAEMYSLADRIDFRQADIIDLDFSGAGAVIMNYTLQFIRPPRRREFLADLHGKIRPGGLLILSEKVLCHDPELNRAYIDFYLDFKRRNGYSETEISRKREALENVLIPFSIKENLDLLTEAGFTSCKTFFQWFNFASLVAVKRQGTDDHA
ncbi:MAG: carboxy-S-adenosyl-L-methionine synthase CmoA [Desulfurivibrionaceae bacterium]|nr:carboxy-S-adenosyl-L-methionine synthase CmoA [Desulfobulbales bacterium]MDT8334335.1 carboxy-S-adenosyl-L-methionine synthase CmoA [Desulfurivibrionaceae bacterium]